MEKFLQAVEDFFLGTGTRWLEALVLLAVGIVAIKLVSRFLRSILHRTKLDGTAVSFLVSLTNGCLILVLFFLVMKQLNIDASSVIAIVAASGLVVGLALQNSLANVASGIILLFSKPFKDGDKVRVGGSEGNVKKIKITNTELITADNVIIIIPNSQMINGELINYSARPTRRLDLNVGVAYEADIDAVKAVLQKLADEDPWLLHKPEPEIRVSELKDSSVNYLTRAWVPTEHYWDVYNAFPEKVLRAFKESGVEIPYNKLNVFVKEEK
ncbi:MAG: mechanosensitive ion channel [Clostridiales bacterium]|jgi:small conductance mechanosensitive channel|nr:mechanosensitive ion channel [Clostridiales bacterium]